MPEQVRLLSDPILRTPCSPLKDTELGGTFIEGLLAMMHDSMKAESGIGLAANQIGISARVFILKKDEGYEEFINPEIVSQDELVDFEGEACLSIPGTFATTKRYKRLKLTWLDKNGVKLESEFEDMKAFAVQHEIDHLNGKLYNDQFGPVKKTLVVNKHRKHLRQARRERNG